MSDVEKPHWNLTRKIMGKIPMFSKYFEKQDLREADFVARSLCVELLEEMQNSLQAAASMANSSDVSDWAALKLTCEQLTAEIRYADQGYSGFFDLLPKDRKEVLNSMCAFDVALYDAIFDTCMDAPDSPAQWKLQLQKISAQWKQRQRNIRLSRSR